MGSILLETGDALLKEDGGLLMLDIPLPMIEVIVLIRITDTHG